jgi:hypothetical protein
MTKAFKSEHVARHNLASAIAETEVWANAHSGYLDEKDPDHRMTHLHQLVGGLEAHDRRDDFDGATLYAIELAAFALHYLALKKYMNVKDPEDTEARRAPKSERPDFAGFAASLREEAKWSAHLHSNDKTGQAASDQFRLNTPATSVEYLGRHLGFMGEAKPPPKEKP